MFFYVVSRTYAEIFSLLRICSVLLFDTPGLLDFFTDFFGWNNVLFRRLPLCYQHAFAMLIVWYSLHHGEAGRTERTEITRQTMGFGLNIY